MTDLDYNRNTIGDSSLPLVVVNPKSASGSTRDNWSAKAADLRAHFGPFAVAFTLGQGDGTRIAERAAREGRRFIIACGGDGTINEVANGILRSGADAELGVFPSGTGGDFRRTLGLPHVDREAAAALRDGVTQRIDVGRVTFVGNDGSDAERYFVNVSSFGLSESIVRRVKSTDLFNWIPVERMRGQANFAVSTLQEVIALDPVMVRVSIDDGEEATVRTINFCIANARYFGGGMMIAPEAKLADGMLDIVNIGDISTAKIVANAHTLYRGTHTGLKEVGSRLARRVEVRPFEEGAVIHLETDGELPGRLPAVYEVVPAALRVRVPQL